MLCKKPIKYNFLTLYKKLKCITLHKVLDQIANSIFDSKFYNYLSLSLFLLFVSSNAAELLGLFLDPTLDIC